MPSSHEVRQGPAAATQVERTRLDDTEVISCPFCDDPGQPVLQEDGWTARQCARCRLVFLSPRPSAAAVARIYTADEAHAPARSRVASFGSPLARLEAGRVIDLLERRTVPGRLLEIGPGGGSVLHAARRRRWVVGAVELNPEQADFIRDDLGIPCWDTLAKVEGTWDVVYHRDVLSHLPDPVAQFRAVHDILRPGGWHVFETGNGDFDRRYDALFSSFQFPDHLFFFSPPSLATLLDHSGFELVNIRSYSLVPQLMLEKLVRRVRGGASTPGSDPATVADAGRSRIGSAARTVLGIARYGARYGLGRLAPKPRRPQDLLVVARRP